MRKLAGLLILTLLTFGGLMHFGCRSARLPVDLPADTLQLNPAGSGDLVELVFKKGESHNHPLMAIWITTTDTQYIQTLYVAQSIGKGVFEHGDATEGKWLPGPLRRPAALPVWAHTRGIMEADGLYIPTDSTPVPDAYTGPTPASDFILQTYTDKPLPDSVRVYFEINQTWDWNEYWTNNRFPDDEEYKASCQPSLVYSAEIVRQSAEQIGELGLLGHGHPSGRDGSVNDDLSTITTARRIASSITVRVDQGK